MPRVLMVTWDAGGNAIGARLREQDGAVLAADRIDALTEAEHAA